MCISKEILISNILNHIVVFLIFSNNLSELVRNAKVFLLITGDSSMIGMFNIFFFSVVYLITFLTEVLATLIHLTLRS